MPRAAPVAPRRLLLGAVVAVAALSGCGSGDGASGGASTQASTKAYAQDVNAFCEDVNAATARFQRDAAALGGSTDRAAAARKFGRALDTLADGFSSGAGRLRGARPPARFEDSMTQAVGALDASARRLRTAARSASTGDADQLAKIASGLGDLRVPQAPTELVSQAPACRG